MSSDRVVNPDAVLQKKITGGYRIVDDFLPVNDFNKLVKGFLGDGFDWYHNHDNNSDELHYFVHTFYTNYGFCSKYHNKLTPIIQQLNPASFVHIRANLFNKHDTVEEFDHCINFGFKHKCMIYFINNNDGYTKLADGTKLYTKENRAVFFDVKDPFIDTTCTNDVFRMTMSFHYF